MAKKSRGSATRAVAYPTGPGPDGNRASPTDYGHRFPGGISSADVQAITPNGTTRCEGQRNDAHGRCTVRDGVYTFEPPHKWAGNRSGEGG